MEYRIGNKLLGTDTMQWGIQFRNMEYGIRNRESAIEIRHYRVSVRKRNME